MHAIFEQNAGSRARFRLEAQSLIDMFWWSILAGGVLLTAAHLTANANLLGHVNLQQETVSPTVNDTTFVEFNSILVHHGYRPPFRIAFRLHISQITTRNSQKLMPVSPDSPPISACI